MQKKYYLSRFWLAITISFFLFIPYLSRYTAEKNRFSFHWTRVDLFSLLFCIALLGIIFFICFVLLCVRGKKLTSKVFDTCFFAILGTALLANISHLVKSSLHNPPDYIIKLGTIAWIFLISVLAWTIFNFKYNEKSKVLCITLCFVISPVMPIFTLNALRYHSFTSDRVPTPTLTETKNQKLDNNRNVYIFIFDEWSYQRSFNNKKLIAEFKNLKQFADHALVFHKATSRWPNTITSIPSLLFQTDLRFVVKGNRVGFQGKQYHYLNQ